MLNTSGGVAGGDRLDGVFELREGARVTVTAQAAETVLSCAARQRCRVGAQPAAWLRRARAWSGCRRRRSCSTAARWIAGWTSNLQTMPGFSAWSRWCSAARPWASKCSMPGCAMPSACGAAVAGCCMTRCGWKARSMPHCAAQRLAAGRAPMATLVHVAPDAEAALDAVRAAMAEAVDEAGASAWNGMLVARILAADAAALRRAVIVALQRAARAASAAACLAMLRGRAWNATNCHCEERSDEAISRGGSLHRRVPRNALPEVT